MKRFSGTLPTIENAAGRLAILAKCVIDSSYLCPNFISLEIYSQRISDLGAIEVCKACSIVNLGNVVSKPIPSLPRLERPRITNFIRHQARTKNSPNAKADAYLQQTSRSMSIPHTLIDYCHSQFSKFPASSLLFFYAVTNKSDFRQIPWIPYPTLYRARPPYVLSVTKPGLFC